MCVFSSVLSGWLLNLCVPIGVGLSPTLASVSVCAHMWTWAGPPLLCPSGAETSQDRRANKAYFLSVGPAGEKKRKKPILLLCKLLFHFTTSLSPSPLWYFAGFLAPVQVWTQYGYWDHGKHLLPWVRLSFNAHSYHLVLNNPPKAPLFYSQLFFFCFDSGCSADGLCAPSVNWSDSPFTQSVSKGPQCAGNGSCLSTSTQRPIYPSFSGDRSSLLLRERLWIAECQCVLQTSHAAIWFVLNTILRLCQWPRPGWLLSICSLMYARIYGGMDGYGPPLGEAKG